MSPFPCIGDSPSCGLWAQLSPATTHPLSAPLLGVLAQALSPLPCSGCRDPPPWSALFRGAAESEGKCGEEGEGSCREEELSHRGGVRGSPDRALLPHSSGIPQISVASSSSYLPPHCFRDTLLFLPRPLLPLGCPAFGTRAPSSPLGVSECASKPSLSPRGLLAVPMPRHPRRLPAGMAAAWLAAEIGHFPAAAGNLFLPAAPPAALASRHARQGRGRLWMPHPRTHTHTGGWCTGWGGCPGTVLLPALQQASREATRTPRRAHQLLVPELGCKAPPAC